MKIDDRYEDSYPNPQSQVDIFLGSWSCELPLSSNINSGGWAKTFVDPKIDWFIEKVGGVEGLTGLELGPLEGGHSWMLNKNGVESLTSIESNRYSFLKCLIVKNLFGMNNVNFLLGDFCKYLERNSETFDFAIASGVLYHLRDPIKALELILQKARHILVWTHYYDYSLVEINEDQRKKIKPIDKIEFDCKSYEAVVYAYNEAKDWDGFCGGMNETAIWYEKKLYLDVCCRNGFSTEVFSDETLHPHGPAFCFLASKIDA